jgi:hypothetical protein
MITSGVSLRADPSRQRDVRIPTLLGRVAGEGEKVGNAGLVPLGAAILRARRGMGEVERSEGGLVG